MSFSLKQGLFKFDIIDRHAILGIGLDADTKKVRQSYLRIVQKLHPDTCKAPTKKEKEFANQLLARLVNPAYEAISKDYGWSEHHLILGQMAKNFAKQKETIQPASVAAKQLLQSNPSALDLNYRKLMQPLVLEQYQNLDEVLSKIVQLSELNLVYLMLRGNWTLGARKATPTNPPATPNSSTPSPPKPEATNVNSASVEREPAKTTTEVATATPYIRRAQEYIEKSNYAQAVLELRDGIKLEPNNPTCHALLGLAYLKQNQVTMAKVHVNKAWQTDPQNKLAQQAKQALEKQGVTVTNSASKPNEAKTTVKAEAKVEKPSGIFSGLFGGKKK
jgi:tetratricopeptide (TPR) repeat protein